MRLLATILALLLSRLHRTNTQAHVVSHGETTAEGNYSIPFRTRSNAINNMNYNNPNMSDTSSQFGKSTDIYSQDYGRRLQVGLRLEF